MHLCLQMDEYLYLYLVTTGVDVTIRFSPGTWWGDLLPAVVHLFWLTYIVCIKYVHTQFLVHVVLEVSELATRIAVLIIGY